MGSAGDAIYECSREVALRAERLATLRRVREEVEAHLKWDYVLSNIIRTTIDAMIHKEERNR